VESAGGLQGVVGSGGEGKEAVGSDKERQGVIRSGGWG